MQYYYIVSKIEKLLAKANNNPDNIRFQEICNLAEYFGFKLKGGRGSHKVYSRKGIKEILTLLNNTNLKRGKYYVVSSETFLQRGR